MVFFGTPNREYWMSADNRPVMERRNQFFYELSGVAVLLFCLFAQWRFFLVCQNPENFDNSVLYAGIVTIVFIVIGAICLLLSFRLPKEKD
jgi:glycerol uptake facilitator-like aquaporin